MMLILVAYQALRSFFGYSNRKVEMVWAYLCVLLLTVQPKAEYAKIWITLIQPSLSTNWFSLRFGYRHHKLDSDSEFSFRISLNSKLSITMTTTYILVGRESFLN